MPAVTHATSPPPAAAPSGPAATSPGADPVARVRRLVGTARDRSDLDPTGLGALTAALARVDAPLDLRIRGGLGSGRRTLAAALRERRGWRAEVDDVDALVAAGGRVGAPPDVEILCLRTAPCRHEEAWLRRPRAHPLLTVATGVEGPDPPGWASGLHRLDARRPGDGSVDAVVAFVERALDDLGTVRVARLAAELERLAVRDGIGDLAEAALCALDGTVRS